MSKLNKILALAFMAFAFVSCSEDLLNTSSTTEPSLAATTTETAVTTSTTYCGSQTFTLWAGQTINAGTLTVANDATNLYVTYTTTGVFSTLHLWVGTDLLLLPKNGQGTPIPGQFPYVFDASGLTTYTFTIPLNSISFYTACGNVIYVVAHAEVSINGGNETAFGGDIQGTGTNRWYYYAAYTTACCETPPPPSYEKLGTAFAKGGYVFTTDRKSNPENLPSLNLTKNRWGWAVNLKTTGFYTYDLWVGAGLNNTTKGKLVGNVTFDYNGLQAVVTYNLLSGFSIEEAHLYAGDFKPTNLAPGQYGNLGYFNPFATSYSFTVDVTDTNGDGVWFIAHAVAYGPGVVNVN